MHPLRILEFELSDKTLKNTFTIFKPPEFRKKTLKWSNGIEGLKHKFKYV